MSLDHFEKVWLVAFEFQKSEGERSVPIHLTAQDWRTKESVCFWQKELFALGECPLANDAQTLLVMVDAALAFACFLALGWATPLHAIDLLTEFRNTTSGLKLPFGNSLLGALVHFGLPCLEAVPNDSVQARTRRGAPWTDSERAQLSANAARQVTAIHRLLGALEHSLDLERALLRGRYMWCVAEMEQRGVPLDAALLDQLTSGWESIQAKFLHALDVRTVGIEKRSQLFREGLEHTGLVWPERGLGLPVDPVHREQVAHHLELLWLRSRHNGVLQFKPQAITLGRDGRNRASLRPFCSKTGRHQPRSSEFALGAPSWFRRVVKPAEGMSLACLDWEQQEFGIAAALSQDPAMLAAYQSGDPYLAFAVQAGVIPEGAERAAFETQREQFKACALGVLNGMSEYGLAQRLGQSVMAGRRLLRLHRSTFPVFWEWSDQVLESARLVGKLTSTFGWQLHVTQTTNDRTLRNFPMQANGAEMLRFAIRFALERDVAVCAPMHDAIVIEAPTAKSEHAIEKARQAMAEASALVLAGFELRTSVQVAHHPEHFPSNDRSGIWAVIASNSAS